MTFDSYSHVLLLFSLCFQQFIVPMGSTIKFRVRMGSEFATNPILLVNLPQNAAQPGTQYEEAKAAVN